MLSSLKTIIAYEFKSTRRSVLFGFLTVVSIIGLVLYQFTPLSNGIQSASDLLQFSVDKLSRALPSSIAYKTAYYYNLVQLLFVTAFIANDTRIARNRALEVLHARPASNAEIVAGSFIGKLLIFSIVNGITFVTALLINAVYYPQAFAWWTYPFYWLTFNLPTLVYLLGLAYFANRFIKHQGGGLLIVLLIAGGLSFAGAGWWNSLFDPCARWIPNLFSDFTGHVNLYPYLLQRGFTLLVGLFFLALSLWPYPRIPNKVNPIKQMARIALCVLLLLIGTGFAFTRHHERVKERRSAYREVYEKHHQHAAVRIARNDLYVEETNDGGISAQSNMVVENRTNENAPIVVYLNPGLKVIELRVEGQACGFKREHQAIELEHYLQPGELANITLRYEGVIEPEICFSDTDDARYFSPKLNRMGIYRFGYRPAICKQEYKLLTPECLWYPVGVSPHGKNGERNVNFSRYSLRVKHAPHLTAISQGAMREEEKGETVFTFQHDIPGITLCVGRYEQRTLVMDSIRLALYYLPEHAYMLERYDSIPEEEDEYNKNYHIRNLLSYTSSEAIQTKEYQNATFMKRYRHEAYPKDPRQEYPYKWFYLVEVPCDFHVFPNLNNEGGERVEQGIMFLPEKMYSLTDYPTPIPQGVEDVGTYMASIGTDQDFRKLIMHQGFSVSKQLRGQTSYLSPSNGVSLFHILADMAHGKDIATGRETLEDYSQYYPVVEYLKNHSLQEALQDETLSPVLRHNIIKKKHEELAMYIRNHVEQDQLKKFFMDFLGRHLFQEVPQELFFQDFQKEFGVNLDTIVTPWFTNKGLAWFEFKDVQVIDVTGLDEPYFLYHFKVFNRGNAPGMVQVQSQKGWMIPPGEGREIRALLEGYGINVLTYKHSQNIPANLALHNQAIDFRKVDTSNMERVLDKTDFPTRPAKEIIVDNEDPGFRVVRRENMLTRWLRSRQEKVYYDYHQSGAWVPVIKHHFFGSSTKSAHVKAPGEGRQKVEWNVALPEEGKYEVFFYHTRINHTKFPTKRVKGGFRVIGSARLISNNNKKAAATHVPQQQAVGYYTVFDGKEEHEVVAMADKNAVNVWISLGVFDFSKNAKVTLSDKSVDKNNTLIADAVKWVRVNPK